MARVGFIEPMECLAADKLPEGPGWLDEIKLDGYRMIVVRNDKPVLYSGLKNRIQGSSLRSLRAHFPPPWHSDRRRTGRNENDGRPDFNLLNRTIEHPKPIRPISLSTSWHTRVSRFSNFRLSNDARFCAT